MDLKNKNILVTGASKGIGRITTKYLTEQGANVIVNYASDEKAANEIVSELKTNSIAIKANIKNDSEVENMFKQIKIEYGELLGLINNAGIFDLEDSPESIISFQNIFEINFLAQIKITNEALKLLKKGKIIFVSSVHGKLGHGRPDAIAYSALKAALDSYMKNLAKHLSPDILVNSIAPGKTLTPMWGDMYEDTLIEHAKDHLINSWIKPEEIADGIIFLLKNDAVCGEILVIDGGMSLKSLG